MCVSSLNFFAAFKRTERGATLYILVPSQTPGRNLDTFFAAAAAVTPLLQTANETFCFQPSARMDAEAEGPVCLPTPVSVPQDLLVPTVRQVKWKPSLTAQPFFFCCSHSTPSLCCLFIHIVNKQLLSNILLDIKKLKLPVIKSTGSTNVQILNSKQVLSNGFKHLLILVACFSGKGLLVVK